MLLPLAKGRCFFVVTKNRMVCLKRRSTFINVACNNTDSLDIGNLKIQSGFARNKDCSG